MVLYVWRAAPHQTSAAVVCYLPRSAEGALPPLLCQRQLPRDLPLPGAGGVPGATCSDPGGVSLGRDCQRSLESDHLEPLLEERDHRTRITCTAHDDITATGQNGVYLGLFAYGLKLENPFMKSFISVWFC